MLNNFNWAWSWVNSFLYQFSRFSKFSKLVKTSAYENHQERKRQITALGISTLSTNWLLWAYAILVDVYTQDSFESGFGYVLAAIHLAAPCLLSFGVAVNSISCVILSVCLAHQVITGYLLGGFNINILTWYAVIPLLGGLLLGVRGVVYWTLLIIGTLIGFLGLHYAGHSFPNVLNEEGLLISRFLGLGGWGVCAVALSSVFIKQRREREEQLRAKTNKINNLLRILTHDVSNSLNVINTASSLFQHYDQDYEKVKYYFEKMDMASANIGEIINCVRTLHNSETQWESLELGVCRLEDSIEHCLNMLECRILEKNIHFEIDWESFKDTRVLADPRLFNNHVLMNILTNAVKFSHFGGAVKVFCKNQGRKVALVVKDQGVGIGQANLKRIFEESENKSTTGTAGEKGTGFGMLIMKSFLERFGGKVYVNSAVGEGTSLTVLLKRAESIWEPEGNDLGLRDFVVKSVKPEEPDQVARAKENGGQKLADNFA